MLRRFRNLLACFACVAFVSCATPTDDTPQTVQVTLEEPPTTMTTTTTIPLATHRENALRYIAAVAEFAEAVSRPAAPRTVRSAPASVHVAEVIVAVGHVNGVPCDGPYPSCAIVRCESGGDPTAQNPSSSASGAYQFIDSTWANFGGYTHAKDAPIDVQAEKARLVWADGAGSGNWSQCGG